MIWHLTPPPPTHPHSPSNVLPVEVDLASDYFSESSASAVRAVFASWPLNNCKGWCVCAGVGGSY